MTSNNKTIELGGKAHTGITCSWSEINRKTARIRKKGNGVEYLGADRDERGKMYCIFREVAVEPGGAELKGGQMFFVDNDVVFDFQKTKKPVRTGKRPPKEELEEE